MGEGTRGARQGPVERLGTRGGSDGLEGRGSRLELQPGPKAELSPVLPGRAHPPELSLLPAHGGVRATLSLDPPSPAQCWPSLGLLGAVPSL